MVAWFITKPRHRRQCLSGCGGRRAEGGGRRAEGGGRKAEGGGRKAEGGRQKAEGGRRKAEGGGRKAEGGRRRAEGGGRKADASPAGSGNWGGCPTEEGFAVAVVIYVTHVYAFRPSADIAIDLKK
jgi:ATP-dependent RNA helicase DHX57